MTREIKLNISGLETNLKIVKEILIIALLFSTFVSSCRAERKVRETNADILRLTEVVENERDAAP